MNMSPDARPTPDRLHRPEPAEELEEESDGAESSADSPKASVPNRARAYSIEFLRHQVLDGSGERVLEGHAAGQSAEGTDRASVREGEQRAFTQLVPLTFPRSNASGELREGLPAWRRRGAPVAHPSGKRRFALQLQECPSFELTHV